MQIRPTWAGATWQNGVVQKDDGSYELPTTTPGVASRVRVQKRCWGLLPARVEAVDARGERLEARAEWNGRLVARDPRSGLETELDPAARTVAVSTPEVKHEIASRHGGYREEYHRDFRQEVDAQGNVRILTSLDGEREQTVVSGPPGQVFAVPLTLQDDRAWNQIDLPRDGEPVAYEMSANKKDELVRGEDLRVCLGQDGRLTLIDEGVSVSFEMFLKV